MKIIPHPVPEKLLRQMELIQSIMLAVKRLNNYSRKHGQYIDRIADYGWYIEGGMFTDEIERVAKYRSAKRIDAFMLIFFNSNEDRIIKELIALYPIRKEIISEGITAHRNKMYFASTIIFLSQADGILEGKLFKIKKSKKEGLNKHLTSSNYSKHEVKILTKIRGIDCFSTEVSNYKSKLNRHAVMHGDDSSFGTEINSYKALSLLAYIAEMTPRKKSI